MHAPTITRQFHDKQIAVGLAIRLAMEPIEFEFKLVNDTLYEITVSDKHMNAIQDIPSPVFVLIQEGGASDELYVHAHSSEADARNDRANCTSDGAYRTSEIIKVSPLIAALGEEFYLSVELLISASQHLQHFNDGQ